MKKPAMSLVSIIVLAVVAYLAVAVLFPYLQKHPINPINSGGYTEYDNSKGNKEPQVCASVKRIQKGYATYETCYDKNGKALYSKKIID